MGICLFWVLVGTWMGPVAAMSQTDPRLEGALWRGVLNIQVSGHLFSQYLENQTEGAVLTGFVKEKGDMRLNFTLEIEFLVNPLGEYVLVAKEDINGKQLIHHEYWHRFFEEKIVKKTRIKTQQQVQVSELSETDIQFERNRTYEQHQFNFGSFQLFPSGRMDKKGILQVKGELQIPIKGTGKVTLKKERRPPSEEYARLRKVTKAQRLFVLPLAFDFNINHRKKRVQGSFAVDMPLDNPFSQKDRKEKALFTNSLKVVGTYSLVPLFGKGVPSN